MGTSERRPIAAGNWKMNLLRRDAVAYCRALRAGLPGEQSRDLAAEVVLFPGTTLLTTVSSELQGSGIGCGGQDVHPAASGAHTGDVSGPQLTDAGCGWVLCGHSERRGDHHEDDALVARKARAATDHGLLPIICLGESQTERAAGSTFEVLRRQLSAALAERPPAFEIAYEPIWAIGTGRTASSEDAQAMCATARAVVRDKWGDTAADEVRIQYGGSVKPVNAAELLTQPDIDGALVGGASLEAASFARIVQYRLHDL